MILRNIRNINNLNARCREKKMRIVIKSWGDFLGIIRSIGLLAMNGYGPDYFVIDKELFFLSVLKHGIEFEKEKVLKTKFYKSHAE